MKYLKRFNEANTETKIDFEKEVKKMDKKLSKSGVTCDSEDITDELVKKLGKEHKSDIKKAVDNFYNT